MIERIQKNEERYDKVLLSINNLQNELEGFKNIKKEIQKLDKYYQSPNWLKDKDAYENNKIPKIKAGVLSEDGLWNMFTSIDEIILDMKRIIADYEKNK